MADEINVTFEEETIDVTIEGTAIWSSLAGKPANYPADAFQTPAFANPLALDGTLHKDFKAGLITGDTTVNLTGVVDGDSGMVELIIDGTGGYTVALGAMFTKQLGETDIDNTANADNFISWRKVGSDIVYTINQVE